MIDSAALTAAMTQAVRHAIGHVARGGIPFIGMLILPDGGLSAPGTNEVATTGDPTAHAEVQAIRAAEAVQAGAATGATLLATGEPCPLCYQIAAERGVAQVRDAVGADEAARFGFDYRGPHLGPSGRRLAEAARFLPVADAAEPFITFGRLHPGAR